ncbi:MAG: polysaccharide biosynthesis tyrosine autokinase [Verrucomicrobiota bacterium]
MDTKIPDAPEMKLHFLDYWRIIRLRKTVILLVFLLVVVTTTAVTFLLPKTYASKARIRIDKDITAVEGIENKPTYSGYDPFWLQTEFDVIQSASVLNEVIRKLGLNEKWAEKAKMTGGLSTEQTYEILKRQISVRPSRNTSLVEIWVYSEDRNEAAEIANTIAAVYRDNRLKVRRQAREEGVSSLREQLKQRDDEVKDLKQVVDDLRRTNEIPDIDGSPLSTTTLNQETLRSLEQARITASIKFTDDATLLAGVSKLDREDLRNSLATIYPYDSLLITLAEKLASGQHQLTALLQEYTPEHAEVKKAQAIVNRVQADLDKKIDGILQGLQTNAESSKAKLDAVEAQVRAASETANTLAAKNRPYYDAKRDLEDLLRIRTALILKIAAVSIETALPTSSIVEVTDPAVVIPRPVRPNKILNIGLGIIIGLIVGVGLAFFIEYLDTSVKTIDDVERALQAPVLGVIPQNVGVLLEEGPDTPHAEAYRVLRTNVLFSRKDDKLNTISVLSGGAGEGKSTTLLNLATSFAQNGSRCLIVDSDLRRPSIHKVLHLSNSIGLTNYLLKQNTLEEVIQTTSLPTLDFMPSGKLPSSSMGILSSEKMKELILELKRRYDFVFFDSPPLLGVSDASILASEMDMILQVVQYRRYPQPMTLRAKQMVQKVGGNLLGIVLNNINMSQDENYYYYSGYYEYSKQNDDSPVKSGKAAKKVEPTKV